MERWMDGDVAAVEFGKYTSAILPEEALREPDGSCDATVRPGISMIISLSGDPKCFHSSSSELLDCKTARAAFVGGELPVAKSGGMEPSEGASAVWLTAGLGG